MAHCGRPDPQRSASARIGAARRLPQLGMDHSADLDELATVDRLIADAACRIRDLEQTMRGSEAGWHYSTKGANLLAALRLALVRYKARRAGIVQFIQDMDSGRLSFGRQRRRA
jgi:hypothetical protein